MYVSVFVDIILKNNFCFDCDIRTWRKQAAQWTATVYQWQYQNIPISIGTIVVFIGALYCVIGNVCILMPLPSPPSSSLLLLLLFILLLCICFLSLCDWLYPFGFVVSSTSRLYARSLSHPKYSLSLSLLFLTHRQRAQRALRRKKYEHISMYSTHVCMCMSGKQIHRVSIKTVRPCIGALLSIRCLHAHIGV